MCAAGSAKDHLEVGGPAERHAGEVRYRDRLRLLQVEEAAVEGGRGTAGAASSLARMAHVISLSVPGGTRVQVWDCARGGCGNNVRAVSLCNKELPV